MDAELKRKWVEALRSGEYKQGDSKLHDPKSDAFCCLGVLCKVAGADFGPYVGLDANDEYGDYDHVPVLGGEIISGRDDEELSSEFAYRIGLSEHQAALIRMNDGFGVVGREGYRAPQSFLEIADYIEANL